MTEHNVTLRQGQQQYDELCAEITLFKTRNSNISPAQVAMRAELCGALDLREEDMPLAGELLHVREEARPRTVAGHS